MLKIKSILVSLLVVAALASCSNENLEENPEVEGGAGYDVAYVSISLTNPKVPGSRASGEQTALEEESAINELYLITFNASKVVTKDERQLSMPRYWDQVLSEQIVELRLRILRLKWIRILSICLLLPIQVTN